MSATVVNIRE